MKTTLALALLAAVALQALGAPTLKEGVAPSDQAIDTKDREKKSYYAQAPAISPCAAAAAGHYSVGGYGAGAAAGHGSIHSSQIGIGGLGGYGAGVGGYGAGIGGYGAGVGGYGAGVGLSSLGHGSLVGPGIHGQQIGHGGIGGFGGFGYGPQHYREAGEEEETMQQEATEMRNNMAEAAQGEMKAANTISDAPSELASTRSGLAISGGYGSGLAISGGYGGGYGGSYGGGYGGAYGGGYGSGLAVGGGYGSGLGLGGAVRPYGGPAVSVFPNSGLGGCGAIPLLLSCSPNLVQGHLVQSSAHHGAYGHGVQAGGAVGGYGYGGSLYRESESGMQNNQNDAKAEQGTQKAMEASQAAAQPSKLNQQTAQQAAAHSSTHIKTSSSSHNFQQQQQQQLQHHGAGLVQGSGGSSSEAAH